MADVTLNALIRKRAEFAGELERYETTVRQLQIDLAHLDATIRLFSPDMDVTKIKPKGLPPVLAARKGKLGAIVFAFLRTAQRPCLSSELAKHVMVERGIDVTKPKLVKLMEIRVCSALRYYRANGLVRTIKTRGEYIRWEIISQDDAASIQ
jgi:hypothetical protein